MLVFNHYLPKTEDLAIILGWNNNIFAKAHQFSALNFGDNTKYVSSSGKLEVIYDLEGEMVLDPRDIGTYNLCPAGNIIKDIGHFIVDVLPWIFWGNNKRDTTNIFNRLRALLRITK